MSDLRSDGRSVGYRCFRHQCCHSIRQIQVSILFISFL
jgi:hypothetical protein